jgi:hypothetical protein
MDLLDRLDDVRRRPHLYGLTTFGEVAAFVTGMDAAASHGESREALPRSSSMNLIRS